MTHKQYRKGAKIGAWIDGRFTRRWKYVTWAIAFYLIGVLSNSMWHGYWKNHSWRIQSPIKAFEVQSPIIIKNAGNSAVLVPSVSNGGKKKNIEIRGQLNAIKYTSAVSSDQDIIMASRHGSILWKIYGLETSWGKTDYCRIHNKGYGGFGVLDPNGIVCYPSFSKAVERAEYWLVKNGIDENIAQALCRWNVGQSITTCNYYKNYLALQ